MELPRLYRGVLVRRYKRFLADIQTPDGLLTAHCPNTGAMSGCAEPGMPVWYSLSDNPKRKYAATWELVDTGAGVAGINTGRANALVREAIESGTLTELADYQTISAETAIPGGGGRFDFSLATRNGPVYVEVKSVTLHVGDGAGEFPDAVSARALKHVHALVAQMQAGARSVLVFCAQHCGIETVRPALSIDPAYAAGLRTASAAGLEVLAYGCRTDLTSMQVHHRLPFALD